MADQVIDVKPLHDDNDRVLGLVIETSHERMRDPPLGRLADSFRVGILWFDRIVDDDQAAPRPVRVPPTEVE